MIDKIKDKYVLVIQKDYSKNKEHFILCEDMDLAKEMFSSDTEKRYITFITRIRRKINENTWRVKQGT